MKMDKTFAKTQHQSVMLSEKKKIYIYYIYNSKQNSPITGKSDSRTQVSHTFKTYLRIKGKQVCIKSIKYKHSTTHHLLQLSEAKKRGKKIK